jgi:hypothetical protein
VALLYSGTEAIFNPNFSFSLPTEAYLTDQPASWAALLSSIAAILNAVAWPGVAAWILFTHRTDTSQILKTLGNKLSAAKKIKAGQFEMEAFEDELKQTVDEVGETVGNIPRLRAVPKEQLQAAENLKEKARAAQLPESSVGEAVKKQIYALANEYEKIRLQLPSCSERTRKMDQIAARMRTLALAGKPLRTLLTRSDSVGRRLAAICMLQIEPRQSYFRWLIERFKVENQPFIFFQSAIAILEYVKKGVYPDGGIVRSAIGESIRVISSFTDGTPDQDTLEVLNEALSLVR